FFQAEDGIRDRNVTGVQTCALPISTRLAVLALGHQHARQADRNVEVTGELEDCPVFQGRVERDELRAPGPFFVAQTAEGVIELRSEERRVGKECRAGWGECSERNM